MLKEVNIAMDTRATVKEAPIVVHCSAGVGRTGTFIAVDWMQRALQSKGKFNVIDSIYALREDRVALVQTADQYKFVHTACKQFCKMNQKRMTIVDAAHSGVDVFSPSVAQHAVANEILIPMAAVPPISLDDIGKPCTVRRFEGIDAVLMWVGFHAKKNAPRCGVVLTEPKGMNDGCLRPAGDPGPYSYYSFPHPHPNKKRM